MNRFRLVLSLSLAALSCAFAARAEDVAAVIEHAEAAAAADHHAEAIRLYEQAIRLDASQRDAILPKVAAQYLWSDEASKSAKLFSEYLQRHSEDCDTRLQYGQALSWAGQLRKSQQEYQTVERTCPPQATEARLGEARVLRWLDRPRKADAAYGDVLWANENARHSADARLGMAQDSLAMDDNRAAHRMFSDLISSGSSDPAAYEGQAVSALHMGLPDEALTSLYAAKKQGIHDESLDDIEQHINGLDRPTLSPSATMFNDGDGTTYRAAEMTGAFGWGFRGRAEVSTGFSRLASAGQGIDGRWAGMTIEQRFSPSWAVRGESRYTDYTGAGFKPFTAELDGIWTPRDGSRIDLSVARIQVYDNMQALRNHLLGTFVSAGTDERITDHDTISASVDDTHWNEGNVRMRYRVSIAHHFESLPGISIELPTMFQTYDRSFSFLLFSPSRYIETGPQINWARHYQKHWQFSASARLGTQKETGESWKGLGTFEGQVERELWKTWGLRCAASWSSSALASPTGFRRRSFSVGLDHRF